MEVIILVLLRFSDGDCGVLVLDKCGGDGGGGGDETLLWMVVMFLLF